LARSASRCPVSKSRSAAGSSGCGASRCRASTRALNGELADGGSTRATPAILDEEGYLFVQGRVDDVIVRGGENLSPGEIEAVLVEHPAVEAAAVVGIPDAEWGERVVAAVVRRGDCTEHELREHVRISLRSARTPERISSSTSCRINEAGKLLRRVVRVQL